MDKSDVVSHRAGVDRAGFVPTGPRTFAIVAGVLAAVSLAAGKLPARAAATVDLVPRCRPQPRRVPAWRASRVEPLAALRRE